MLFKTFKQVSKIKARVVHQVAFVLDKTPGQVLFKPLQTHDLLFNCVLQDQTVHVHCSSLADTMSSVHRLQIFHRVPVVLQEDN